MLCVTGTLAATENGQELGALESNQRRSHTSSNRI